MRISRMLSAALVLTGGLVASAAEFSPWTDTAEYELEYRVDLAPLLAGHPKQLRIWLPAPAETEHQKVRSQETRAPRPCRETQDAYGNRFVYLELDGTGISGTEAVLRFVVQRSPDDGIKPADIARNPRLDPQRYLGPQSRVPLEGRVRDLAEQESRACQTDVGKIRAFYDYVLRTMRYDKSGQGWGEGDVNWACTAHYGNCTDFHSLLMGLARAAHIPARFVIGFPLAADKVEGDVSGYHCWAEVYDPERGWLPVDASEAWKSKRYDDYFGRLPSDRVAFTVGRDLVLEPPQTGVPLNFFIYPYAEADGQPVPNVPWKLHFRRLADKPRIE
jgi:transglutaminase-like putative cysteine protease